MLRNPRGVGCGDFGTHAAWAAERMVQNLIDHDKVLGRAAPLSLSPGGTI